MESLSVAASSIALAQLCIGTIGTAQKLQEEMRTAPPALKALREELLQLQESLQQLRDILPHDRVKTRLAPASERGLSSQLLDTGSTLDEMHSILMRNRSSCGGEEKTRSLPESATLGWKMKIQQCSANCVEFTKAVSSEQKSLQTEMSPRHLHRQPHDRESDDGGSDRSNCGVEPSSTVSSENNKPLMEGGRNDSEVDRTNKGGWWLDYVLLAVAMAGATLMNRFLSSVSTSPAMLCLGTGTTGLALTTYHYLHEGERYQDVAMIAGVGAGLLALGLTLGWEVDQVDLLRLLPWCGIVAMPLSTYVSSKAKRGVIQTIECEKQRDKDGK